MKKLQKYYTCVSMLLILKEVSKILACISLASTTG